MATYAAYRHVELDNVGYGKKRVLKPPGGGSSNIFASGGEAEVPRPAKHNYHYSQMNSTFLGYQDEKPDKKHPEPLDQTHSTNGGIGAELTGSATKTGKDPNDDEPTIPIPNTNRRDSGVSIGNSIDNIDNVDNIGNIGNIDNGANGDGANGDGANGDDYVSVSNRTSSSKIGEEVVESAEMNLPAGLANAGGYNYLINGNGYDPETAFRRIKRSRNSTCMPRNPVTGDGIYTKPPGCRRIVPKKKDGNPVTGAGYEFHQSALLQSNGNGNIGDTTSVLSDKSSTDSSSSATGVTRMKNRVPPGGYSNGLW